MILLANMLGATPGNFQFMPIGAIVISMTMFVVYRHILGSPSLASLLTLYLVLNLSHASALYSIFAYAFGLPIFLCFVILSIQFLRERNYRDYFVLLIIYISLNFIHYTMTVWVILFILGVSITVGLQRGLAKKQPKNFLTPAYYLATAFIVFFLIFNNVLYDSYLPLVKYETLDSATQRFFAYFFYKPESITSQFTYDRPIAIDLLSTLTLCFILMPVIIGIIHDLTQMVVNRKKLTEDKMLPLIWGIVFLGIFDALSYSLRGSISTKSFSMIFPLISILYLMRTRKRVIYYGVAMVFLATSVVKVYLFYNEAYVIPENGTRYRDVMMSSKWIQSHTEEQNYTMLSDLNLYGKYLVLSIDQSTRPILRAYTLNDFQWVINEGGLDDIGEQDIIAVDKKSYQPTLSFVWQIYKPLSAYLANLYNNPHLNVIYDDGLILLATKVGTRE